LRAAIYKYKDGTIFGSCLILQRYYYHPRHLYLNGIIKWAVIAYLSITVLFCIIWFLPNSDKINYKRYKNYESKIEKKEKEITNNGDKYLVLYYSNKISKKQIIGYLKQTSDDLNKLYKSFDWNKGDEVTKELFCINKQILIIRSEIYRNKAMALEKGIISNETDDVNYINSLVERYNIKEKLQKEKYELTF
jgi:hypothetical protein